VTVSPRNAPDLATLPGSWIEDAVCADPAARAYFFPDRTKGQATKIKIAKWICNRCPVRPECLAWALEMREPAGIWGGLSTDERDELRLAK
jgi:WhiB family redox-sensing transcriptional regulator